MRSTQSENIAEHSLDVAVIAHALALLRTRRFGLPCDAERAAVLGLFHDATEIITGDLPTPVRHHNPEIRRAYGEVGVARGRPPARCCPRTCAAITRRFFGQRARRRSAAAAR